MKKIDIDGGRFSNLTGFYDEVERCLTSGSGWNIGRNLDAFDEVLEGGFGVHEVGEHIEINWLNHKRSKLKLGYGETVKYFQDILGKCHPSAKRDVKHELELAKNEKGDTLFDIIVEIIEEHQHVKLNLK
jgi:RNAse (barnase) inhibitor barstar